MKESFKVILKFVLAVIVILAITALLWNPLTSLFSNSKSAKEFILGFHSLAPVIFIFLIALQVIISPIPGQIAGLTGGFLFGALLGTIYSMIGLVIGSYIVFFISRKFGRPFVEKVVSKKNLGWFDKISEEKGAFTLFMIYLLPMFPDDIISYLAGLTKIRMRNLMLISFFGRLPGFIVLSLVGGGLASENSTFSITLLAIMIVLSVFLFLFRNRLEKIVKAILEKFRKN